MIPIIRAGGGNSSRRRKGAHARGGGGSSSGGGDGEGADREDDDLLDLEQGNTGSNGNDVFNPLTTVPILPPPLDDSLDPRTGKPLAAANGAMGGSGAIMSAALQHQEEEIAPIVRYHNLVMVQRAVYLVFQVF